VLSNQGETLSAKGFPASDRVLWNANKRRLEWPLRSFRACFQQNPRWFCAFTGRKDAEGAVGRKERRWDSLLWARRRQEWKLRLLVY